MIYVTCHICVEAGATDPRAATPGSYLCGPCRQVTKDILNEIQHLHDWISDPHYLASTREPASSYTKSRPPVSLHTISLLDPRTKMRRKGDPVSAHRVLKAWNDAVWRETGDCRPLAPTLNNCVWYLRHRLDWISAQPAVTRFARHVAGVLHSLRQEVGLTTSSDEGESDE